MSDQVMNDPRIAALHFALERLPPRINRTLEAQARIDAQIERYKNPPKASKKRKPW